MVYYYTQGKSGSRSPLLARSDGRPETGTIGNELLVKSLLNWLQC